MKTNILTLVITLTLGVILAGSLLMPVISDAQTNIGNETTLSNTMRTPELNYNLWDGSDIEFQFVFDSQTNTGTYYIDGVEQTSILTSNTQRIVLASNEICYRTAGGSSPAVLNIQVIGGTTGFTHSFTYTIVDKEYTFTDEQTHDVITGTVDWLVYAADVGTANLGTLNVPTSAFYTSNMDKIVILGNVYTTGDNDTFYSYYDGDLTVNEEYQDVSNVVISRTLADGYTDIYDTTVTVNIGEESFTPYFILAPKSVSGHEAAGPMYDLLGVIPIIMIVGLVLLGVGAIYTKRND